MPITIREVIYLGTFADADTDEGTLAVENTAVYQQTFGSPGNPLNSARESITFDDQDSTNAIETDNMGTTDTTDGAGGLAQLDSLAVVNATITYLDGSTATYDNVVMFQTDNGELFLANSDFAGTDIRGPDQKEIQSMTVNSVTATDYTALLQNNFQSFACFAQGTLLTTPEGPRAIETLRAGDLVDTADHGAQPIRWIGKSTVLQMGKMAPLRVACGALGCGLPRAALFVSQQHRMLVRSAIIRRITGQEEALIAAKCLLPCQGIDLMPKVALIKYLHVLFDHHEVIFAEGCPTESLFPGPQAAAMLGPQCTKAIAAITKDQPDYAPARPFLEGAKRRQAIRRHLKNGKPLLNPKVAEIRAPKLERSDSQLSGLRIANWQTSVSASHTP